MKKIYLLLMLSCLGFAVNAQTAASYVFSQSTTTYTALSSGTSIITPTWDDNLVTGVPLGFTFVYLGASYSTIDVHSNGYINFTGGLYTVYNGALSTFTNCISVMSADLYGASAGPISYQTLGSSPNRIFVLQWQNFTHYSSTAYGPNNMQMKLYESSNIIEFNYGAFSGSSTTSFAVQVGINGSTTSDYNNRTTTSNWSATTAGGSNGATCTQSNTIKPSNGLTFRWTPPPTLTRSPATLTYVTAPSTTTGAQTVNISGYGFSSSPITVASSSSNFEVYNGSSWVSSYTISAATNGGLYIPTTAVPVRFVGPSSVGAYTGNINFTGGGLSATSVAVTGNVVVACTGTPTAGTSSVSPLMGGASTPFMLTASGYTVAGSIAFQWQSSSTGTSGWSNISGATNATHSFTGITANTYYRCNVTCTPSSTTVSGASCVASFYPPSTCTPSFIYPCSSYPMNASIASLVGLSSSISDVSNTGTASTSCPTNYVDNSASMSVTLLQGVGYNATLNIGGPPNNYYTNFTTQVWIDYNNDGAFSSTESVGGWAMYAVPSNSPVLAFTVSPTASVGVHRMRIVGYYNSVASGTLANYPTVNPCPSSSQYYYGNVRDYAVNIIPPPPTVSASPTSLSFGSITVGTTSAISVVSLSGIYLPDGGTLTLTAPTNFEISLDGIVWYNSATPISYDYPGTTFTGFTTIIYTRFIAPITAGAYGGNITVTGGSLAATYNIALSGNSAAGCSAVPTAGTASINGSGTSSGNSGTSFVLNTSGTSVAGGLTYQWQTSPNGTSSWVNIPGGNTIPFTYTGLSANTWFRCIVTCPSFTAANTNTVSATFVLPASSCTPTAYYTSSTYYNTSSGYYYYVGTTGNPVVINGASGSISDASVAASGTGGSPMYYNSVSSSVTFNPGSSYTTIMGASNGSYMGGSVWIDFNDDGVFSNATELVGGYRVTTSPGTRPTPTLLIPAGAAPGAHRMRVNATYHGNNMPGASAYYPSYPLANPCPNSTPSPYVYYSDTRDYTAIIVPPPPVVTAAPTTVAFGNVTTGTISAPVSFSKLVGTNLVPSAGMLTITSSAPTVFEMSSNGTSWSGSLSYGYSGGGISGRNLYVRFKPGTPGSASATLTISGGGLASAVTINVTGTGATACTGTPTAGTATLSNTEGGATTPFTLSLSGMSAVGGLTYQWQSGPSAGSLTNINGAITSTYNFVGISATTYFRCVVTCPSGSSSNSNVVSASYIPSTLTGTACSVPAPMYGYCYGCGFYVAKPGNPFIFTGDGGSSINDDVSFDGASLPLIDRTATYGCNVSAGGTYNVKCFGSVGNTYTSLQMWIDFNGDNTFSAGESIGGGNFASGTPQQNFNVTLPTTGVSNGVYRMRVGQSYTAGSTTSTGVYPAYPNLNPCGTGQGYHEYRDYKVTIGPPPAPLCTSNLEPGIVSPSLAANCSAFTPILYSVGSSSLVSGLTYQWQSSATGSSWTNVSGATGQGYTPSAITTPGTTYYRRNLTCAVTSATTSTPGVPVTFNAPADVSNFTSTTATNSCSGSGSTVTVNSTSLGAGAFTATFNLSGANTSTGNTATLTMGASSGTFTIPAALLASQGLTTVTVTLITSSGGCIGTPAGGNVAGFGVGVNADASNYTATSATTVCQGVGSVVTISSTSIGTTTSFMAVYNVSGANSSTGNTAALTMTSTNGTFTIPTAVIASAGSNTVTVTGIRHSSGCTSTVAANNTSAFVVNTAAAVNSMTGGGSYCTGGDGVPVGLSGTTTGNTYQLYRGATAIGSGVAGTGAALSFGIQTIAGIYSVVATNTSSPFCAINMSGTSVVSLTSSPVVYTVSGGGAYCSGAVSTAPAVTLSASDAGASYQLYNGATPMGSLVTGTGAPISLGTQTMAGTYTIIVNPGAGVGCQMTMSGSATVVVNPLPTAYTVTGGGNYCTGSASGAAVGMSFGSTGVLYDLKMVGGGTVTSAAGTNSAISFGTVGAGTYSVMATITATGCTNAMSGTATVSSVTSPVTQTVTGGGGYCSGGTGVAVGLGNSVSGTSYQIFNGISAGSIVSGSGAAITFGSQTATGVYTVMASLTSGTTTCTTPMTGSATVIQNPTPTVFTVTGGGNYCTGGTGSSIGLNGSQAGVNYLVSNGTASATVAGTGAAISFGTFTSAGTYSVLATNGTTSCVATMSGTAVIAINALPLAYSVGGGGSYCNGGAGYSVTLSGSQSGVNYVLYRSGSPVMTLAGTGGSLNFGTFPEAGLYTVVATNATTGCVNTMSGSATITINPLPVVYPVNGGGNYCSGGTGVAVGLGGSDAGIRYTAYNGAVPMTPTVNGTGSPISFGVQTLSGSYTVFAQNLTTGCTNNMSGSTTVGINPLPTAYAVTGTGNYCAGGTGVAVGLGSSTGGVTYNLYNGASLVGSMAGSGAPISFGMYTAAATYTVQAVNATTSCVNNMSGAAVVGINALPTVYAVTSSGTNYCSGTGGIAIGMTGSTSGVDYQLYMGSTPIGSAVSGTGSGITFGSKTAAGTYTVVATNATTGCMRNMSGSASITIDALPVVYGVTGGGNYCSGGTGVNISLTGSESGTAYQLYSGAATIGSAVSGTGAALSIGTYTAAGTYTVLATNAAGCTKSMTGAATVSINSLPVAQTVTASGTNYCAGTSGITIGLTNSAIGVNYQLYNGVTAVGSPVAGTGSPLSLGAQTAPGTYMVIGADALTGCTKNMNGTANISVNPAPAVYSMTGGGSYCSGNTGVGIGLSGSNSGVNYQLYNGALAVGGLVSGTGAALNFGTYTTSGTYVVVASDGITSCTSNMAGGATVVMNALPSSYTVTGGGSYCNGGSGLHIGLSGSTPGIAYQLYNGASPVGSFTTGTGLALDFGVKTAGGTYSVIGYNPATTCFATMSGSAIITVNSLPVVHTVTGGGSYCNGGTGVNIGLSNSTPGVSYQLYNGTATAGAPVFGTSDPIDFGAFTGAGTYSVLATSISTSCQSAMSGTAAVSISPLPSVQTVTGGGTVCQGTAGSNVYLNNTNAGINYQLYNNGAPVGAPVPGTGSALSFGPQNAAGTYTVQAINATTSCTRNMSGAATINVNSWPALHTITGGGNYCSGSAGSMIGLGSSTPGVNYQVYNGTTPAGSVMSGTGGAIAFGSYTATGTYTIMGINATTGCTRTMTGTATIGISNLPTAYTLGGGGNYCAGGAGVGMVLSGSNTGITYQLYNGTTAVNLPVTGTGGPLSFGLATTAGSYMVIATNDITSCTSYMSGNPSVNVNALPVAYTVSGGGQYCAGGTGVDVTLSGSNTGVSYQLYKGGAIAGTAVAGTGGDISFGNQMAQGTYTVMATNTATSCSNAMNGSASVMVNALPTANTVTGGGTICAGQPGVVTTMNTSTPGVNYQLMLGTASVGPVMSGTGGAINFTPVTVSGTYMVMATDATTACAKTMNGSAVVVVNAVPVAQTVTGGGNYCSGGNGVAVGLAGSVSGVAYQLMNGTTATGSPVTGNGGTLSFGLQTAAGVYAVTATNSNGCMSDMTGTATVNVNALPATYAVLSMGSSYCAGGDGVRVLLSGSTSGILYQLYRNGAVTGAPVTGTGAVVDFGSQTAAGNYTVMAYNAATTCSVQMTGSATIIVNALPTAYTITGGGGYCNGSSGSEVYLDGSNTGINYQLFNSTGSVGSPVAGNGGPISFGPQTAGTYMVIATNPATTCTKNMTGTVTSVMNALPTAYGVTGGGAYCAGGTGVEVGLSNSSANSTYQLYRNGSAIGSAVSGIGGTISFGLQTAAGDYTVMAANSTSTCSNNMTGSATVSISALPAAETVTGGGDFCAGSAGVSVGLAGSAAGSNYQLYRNGGMVSGAVLAGGSGALDFGTQTASGSYNVIATSTGNGCTNVMTGSVAVTANPLPVIYSMTGGGNYCASATSTGVGVGLSGSTSGVNYQLYNGTMAVGAPVAGTGSAISFGMQAAAGDYTAMAVNGSTSCTANMSGSAVIVVNPVVVPEVTIATAAGNTVCLGVLTTFTANNVNGGTAPAYQWKVNGANAGLGTNSYAYVPGDGDVVSVSMTSSAACATPATATSSVTMNVSSHQMPNAKVMVTPGETVCQGTMVTYNVTPEYGGAAPTYVWKKNGVIVGGGTSYAYVPNDKDVITCEMTSNFACRLQDVVSTDVTMIVQAPVAPSVSIAVSPMPIVPGQNVTLTVTAVNANGTPAFRWSVNGEVIASAITNVFSSNNFKDGDEVTCEVTSNGACGPLTGSRSLILNLSVGVAAVTNIESDIRLIPNPNNGDFTIKGSIGTTDDKDLNVEVVSMLGQVVYKGTVQARNGNVNERIQISKTLANGMYILNLRSETEAKAFHFVLQQ